VVALGGRHDARRDAAIVIGRAGDRAGVNTAAVGFA